MPRRVVQSLIRAPAPRRRVAISGLVWRCSGWCCRRMHYLDGTTDSRGPSCPSPRKPSSRGCGPSRVRTSRTTSSRSAWSRKSSSPTPRSSSPSPCRPRAPASWSRCAPPPSGSSRTIPGVDGAMVALTAETQGRRHGGARPAAPAGRDAVRPPCSGRASRAAPPPPAQRDARQGAACRASPPSSRSPPARAASANRRRRSTSRSACRRSASRSACSTPTSTARRCRGS